MTYNRSSKEYKTISYKLYGRGKKLIIIFPRAAARFETHEKLVDGLCKFGTVLFLESGYFGMSIIKSNIKDLIIDNFCHLLRELTIKLRYSEILLIGESVGAIHALNYARHYPDQTKFILLSNPAFYKSRLIRTFFFISILNLGLNVSPNFFLKFFGKTLKIFANKKINYLGNAFINMAKTPGGKSYLSCLKEIIGFRKRYMEDSYKKVLQKSFILGGKEDIIFNLCNRSFCKIHSQFIEVPLAEHGIIDHKPEEVFKVLYTFPLKDL